MRPKVYLETSFVSYLVSKLSYDLTTLQRQLSSQRWWETRRSEFDLLVSEIVHNECRQGDREASEMRSAVLTHTRLLPLTGEIMDIARRLVDPGPFPKKAAADALHLAAATAFGCEYLLTWNFKHINNAQIKRESTRIIEEYGYNAPTICTPEELMGSDGAAEG